jgi:antitoxin HicB
MHYHFRIHKDQDGLWAECVELPGCMTQADSIPDLEKNMIEALSLYLDEPADSSIIFPLPRKKVSGKNIVAVPFFPNSRSTKY